MTDSNRAKLTDSLLRSMAQINAALEAFSAAADDHFEIDAETANWGHAGSLANVASRLTELVSDHGIELPA